MQSLPLYPSLPMSSTETAPCQCARDKSPLLSRPWGRPWRRRIPGSSHRSALFSSLGEVTAACEGVSGSRRLSTDGPSPRFPGGHPLPKTEPPKGQEALLVCPLPAASELSECLFIATAPGCTSGPAHGTLDKDCVTRRRERSLGTAGY